MLALALACAGTPAERAEGAAREHRQRGDLALARGRAEVAEREYTSALSLRADDAPALLGLARALAAQGRSEEALAAYEALDAVSPEALAGVRTRELCPLLLGVAEQRIRGGQPESSLDLAQRARLESCEGARVAPVLAHALALVAEARRESDPVGAADLFAEAAAADPADPANFVRAGVLLLWVDRREEALALLSEALRRHPQDPDLQALMVDALAHRAPGIDPFSRVPSGAEGHGP